MELEEDEEVLIKDVADVVGVIKDGERVVALVVVVVSDEG